MKLVAVNIRILQMLKCRCGFCLTSGKNRVSPKKAEIVITNKGKSPLEIRSMQLFTPGIEITLAKQKLNAGESTKMKITGYAQDLSRVKSRPRILMITNDPRQQKVIIEIKK